MASKWSELAFPWQTALAEAWEAYKCGSLPIGAVEIAEKWEASGWLISQAEHNQPISQVFSDFVYHFLHEV